ncbi:cytidine/deoxycytidylate deaminase family protein [Bacillus spizizenii]|nr:cytidine/deoxycytidylate deaminase family protein [Bacillus spizizenii]MCY8890391.1 cytidine/deoxycytidylate deaminase family protein [Bacillus spizizenii]MEC0841846.1 cytidine/deoxycytidylate deaminase family protein [Bacillus spizizenii]
MRKSWDSYFLDIAEKVAERSTCDRLHVGAVIVKDKLIVSTGYNGSIQGQDHCSDAGHLLNEQGRCVRTIHAEQNAIIFASRDELQGATAYVTHEPCETCTKLLIQSGVKRIVFAHLYKNSANHHFYQEVRWEHHEPEVQP